MKNWKILSLVILLTATVAYGIDCNSVKSCDLCTRTKSWPANLPLPTKEVTCRWCPLSQECHAAGSPVSHCSTTSGISNKAPDSCKSDNSGPYDKQLAYEQLLLSSVAYSEEPEICLDKIGESHNEVDSDMDMYYIAIKCHESRIFLFKKCAAIVSVSHSKSTIFVSFRGTASDPQLVAEAFKVAVEGTVPLGNGHVQNYFYEVFDLLEGCLTTRLTMLHKQYPTYNVRFNGHSLGGALASIAAFTYVYHDAIPKDKVSLYTYGMPRVGDKLFAVHHDLTVSNSFRVVNYKDCVPQLPPCRGTCALEGNTGPYHHRREVFYNTPDMKPESEPIICHGNEDSACSRRYNAISLALACKGIHTSYFGIPVGSYCETLTGYRRKRSDEPSDIEKLLKDNQCSVLQKINGNWKQISSPSTTPSVGTQAKPLSAGCLVFLALTAWNLYVV